MKNEDFVTQLILKADPDIDEVWLELLIWDVKQSLEEWVYTNILSKLNGSQRDEFIWKTMIDSYNEWDIYKYLSLVIPDYENFIWQVYDKFEKMYLNEFKYFSKNNN